MTEMKNKDKAADEAGYSKMKPGWLRLAAGVCAYLSVLALPWLLQMQEKSLTYTNSIVSFFLFLLLGLVFYKILAWIFRKRLPTGAEAFAKRKTAGVGEKRRMQGIPVFAGTLFAVSMVFGYELDRNGNVPFLNLFMWAAIVGLAVLSALVVRKAWEWIAEKSKEALEENAKSMTADKRSMRRQRVWLYAVAIFFLYLPVFFAVYPGFFVYDAQEELMQVMTRNFSTHHPLGHVLLLGGTIQLIYKLTGSYNLGIACYTLLQMTLMAGIFGWCVWKCHQKGLKEWGCVLLTAYFGLCPVLVMFSLCSAKDGLFTGALAILVIQLQQLCEQPEDFFASPGNKILFGAAGLAMMLLRHNGFYAFLAYGAVLTFSVCIWIKREKPGAGVGIWRKHGRGILLCLLMIFITYFAINTALTVILQADDSEHQEVLTVPISQLARVYAYEKDSISSQEQEMLYCYLPEDALARYTPKVTDGVKLWFNNETYQQDAGSFWHLWAKLGKEHPFAYLNAWMMTSYGFWYPDTVIDVYRGNTVFTYTYKDSSYFGYEVEQPGMRESKIPWLDELYRKMSLEIAQQKIPVVSMLFSPGFLFWSMIFGLGYLGYTGRWKKALPYGLVLLVWLTFLLGPTYLVRYVVFLWVVVPLLIQDIWMSNVKYL